MLAKIQNHELQTRFPRGLAMNVKRKMTGVRSGIEWSFFFFLFYFFCNSKNLLIYKPIYSSFPEYLSLHIFINWLILSLAIHNRNKNSMEKNREWWTWNIYKKNKDKQNGKTGGQGKLKVSNRISINKSLRSSVRFHFICLLWL